MPPHLTVTAAAEKFMRRIVRFSGLPAGAGFRLVVSAGGCSGYSCEFSPEAAPQPGDETLLVYGLPVFLPAASHSLLDGGTMDFADSPGRSGLGFSNPNQPSCACSSSGAQAAPPGVARIEVGAIGRGRPAAPAPSP